jgi:hypothetical protein
MTDAMCWVPKEGKMGSSIKIEDGLGRRYRRKVLMQPLYLPDIIQEEIDLNLSDESSENLIIIEL